MDKDYSKLLAGTNIDVRSYLSTDYFNHFNEAIMLFNMLPDMPDMLDEIDKWDFKTYRQHFTESGLAIAPLAIEVYPLAPAAVRDKFEKLAVQMAMLIVETRVRLRAAMENNEIDRFKDMALLHSMELQGMVDDGGAIVHGHEASFDQLEVDNLFDNFNSKPE